MTTAVSSATTTEISSLHDQLATLQTQLTAAQTNIATLMAAQSTVATNLATAKASLSALDQTEQTAMASWAATASGNPPTPDMTTRQTLNTQITQYQTESGQLSTVIAQKQNNAASIRANSEKLAKRLNELMVVVLMAKAEDIGASYKAELTNLVSLYSQLIGLNAVLGNIHYAAGSPQFPDLGGLPRPMILPPLAIARYIEAPMTLLNATASTDPNAYIKNSPLRAYVQDSDVQAAATSWQNYLAQVVSTGTVS